MSIQQSFERDLITVAGDCIQISLKTHLQAERLLRSFKVTGIPLAKAIVMAQARRCTVPRPWSTCQTAVHIV